MAAVEQGSMRSPQGRSISSLTEWDIQTEFCNFYKKTAVHPWNNLTRKICHTLDDEAFTDLITLARNHLGEECDTILGHADRGMLFFTSLEKKYKEHVTEILLNLFSHTNMHVHSGMVRIADKIREYQRIENEFRSSSKLPLGHGSNLFGREQLILDCLDCLTGRQAAGHVGVVLCGLSGMGKTSLAAEICYKLQADDPAWVIVTINQRGKTELWELCADLVSGLLRVLYPGSSDREGEDGGSQGLHGELYLDCLKKEALQLLKEQCGNQIGRKLLLWLDDLDGHSDRNMESREQLCVFLQDLTNLVQKQTAHGKVQLLLTVARKLGREQEPVWMMNQRLGDSLREVEVPGLTPADTEAIVRSVAGLQDKDLANGVAEKLCELCCGSPIAIRAVADLLRDKVRVPEILGHLRCERPVLDTQLAKCMGKALEKLDIDVGSKESRELLVQLTVFQSAEFDVNDVLAVSQDWDDKQLVKYMRDVSKAQIKVRLIEFKARHLLEINSHFKKLKKESHAYSLHPLVVKYLQNVIKESKELKAAMDQAEFRFLRYFYQKVLEFTVKQNKSPVKTKFKIEDKWVHLKHFFELLLSDTTSVFDLTPTASSHKMSRKSVTVQHGRLWKLAQSFLHIEEMRKFPQIQAQHARERQNYCGYIYWTCVEAENLVQREKYQLADKIFTAMINEVGESISSDVKEIKLGINVQKYEWPPVEVVPVYATYCYTQGKLHSVKKSHDRALDYLTHAESLYEGHVPNVLRSQTGKERISKREFRGELARVANLIGVVYFDKEDYETARTYHIKAYETIKKELDENVKWHEDYTEYLSNWATTFHQEGLVAKDAAVQQHKYSEAMSIYNRCIETDKTMKRDLSFSHGIVLFKRAEIHYLQDDYERALTDLKRAKRIMRDKFRPPNIHITLSCERMAEYLFKLGKKQKKEHKVEADMTLNAALEEFDYALSYIVDGGLPIDHNNHRTYRKCKEKHLELLQMLRKKTSKIEDKYRRFETGYYDKQIQQNREDDVDWEAFTRQIEEGELELVPCSDSSDTDSSDESSSSGVTRSSSSSGDQPHSMMEKQDTIEEKVHRQGTVVEMDRQDSMVTIQDQNAMVDNGTEVKGQDAMLGSGADVKGQDSSGDIQRQDSGIASMEVEPVGAARDSGFGGTQEAQTPGLVHQRGSIESMDQGNNVKEGPIEIGVGRGRGTMGYRDTRVSSQEKDDVELRPRDSHLGVGVSQRPSVRDSGLGESSEYEDKQSMTHGDEPRRQLKRQSSIDESGHIFRQPFPSTSDIGHTTFSSTSQNIPQRPASLSVPGLASRKRSIDYRMDDQSPGLSMSASQRRESWQTFSPSGSAESGDELGRSWRSSGSQDSVTAQFNKFSPFQRKPSPDAFEDADEEEEEPVTKRARTSLEHHGSLGEG